MSESKKPKPVAENYEKRAADNSGTQKSIQTAQPVNPQKTVHGYYPPASVQRPVEPKSDK